MLYMYLNIFTVNVLLDAPSLTHPPPYFHRSQSPLRLRAAQTQCLFRLYFGVTIGIFAYFIISLLKSVYLYM